MRNLNNCIIQIREILSEEDYSRILFYLDRVDGYKLYGICELEDMNYFLSKLKDIDCNICLVAKESVNNYDFELYHIVTKLRFVDGSFSLIFNDKNIFNTSIKPYLKCTKDNNE